MLITLIRHGETVANVDRIAQGHSDGQLTERGIFQACQLRKRLAKEKITHLIVSDLGRTKHTAWLALGPSVCVHGGTHMCDNGVDVDSVASDILDAGLFLCLWHAVHCPPPPPCTSMILYEYSSFGKRRTY
eukprot:Rmarinus@m.20347